jgi:hypothetical protein
MKDYSAMVLVVVLAAGWTAFIYALPLGAHF